MTRSAATVAAPTSIDAVPELFHYEDTGCEVSLSCLSCPLPQCKYDDPAWFQRYLRMSKDLKVLTAMRRDNLTVEQAAERFSVTVRTIFRILRRCRETPPDLEELDLLSLAAD